jgi:hypothetical protein
MTKLTYTETWKQYMRIFSKPDHAPWLVPMRSKQVIGEIWCPEFVSLQIRIGVLAANFLAQCEVVLQNQAA